VTVDEFLPDGIERTHAPGGTHSPMHHGGEFDERIMEAINRAVGTLSHSMTAEHPIVTEQRRAYKVKFATYYLDVNTPPFVILPYQPNRKRAVIFAGSNTIAVSDEQQGFASGNCWLFWSATESLEYNGTGKLYAGQSTVGVTSGTATAGWVNVMEEIFD
jgi:hypothetical protein